MGAEPALAFSWWLREPRCVYNSYTSARAQVSLAVKMLLAAGPVRAPLGPVFSWRPVGSVAPSRRVRRCRSRPLAGPCHVTALYTRDYSGPSRLDARESHSSSLVLRLLRSFPSKCNAIERQWGSAGSVQSLVQSRAGRQRSLRSRSARHEAWPPPQGLPPSRREAARAEALQGKAPGQRRLRRR